MQAKIGDWLLVPMSRSGGSARRGVIMSVTGVGHPPYTVRWIDDGRETVVFPGPDAGVISAERQVELDRAAGERIDAVQAAIAHPRPAT